MSLPDLLHRLDALVWGPRARPLSAARARALRIARIVVVVARDLAGGQLTLRAMSLVYTTLLSIVPLLALSFSVLKAFGVSNQIQPVLKEFLAPLGPQGNEIAARVVQFINNMNVGVLGAVGLALLLYTVISLMQKIEESLNFIWRIPAPRALAERFSRYLSVLMVGPLLVFAALGITATVLNIDAVQALLSIGVLGEALRFASRLVPYLLVIGAFTFVYVFIPNTRVRLLPALIGGVAGGIAWQTAGWAFAVFVVSSNNYSAIYSGLAILVLFMIWIYVSWLILLFGADVAFYAQHPEYLRAKGNEPRLSNRMRERLALSLMSLAAQRFVAGARAPTLDDFTAALALPMRTLQEAIDALEDHALLLRSAEDPPGYAPARDLDAISVAQVLAAARSAGENAFMTPSGLPAPARVDDVLARLDRAMADAGGTVTLRALVAPLPDTAAHDSVIARRT